MKKKVEEREREGQRKDSMRGTLSKNYNTAVFKDERGPQAKGYWQSLEARKARKKNLS
jgi:hypothetical protein